MWKYDALQSAKCRHTQPLDHEEGDSRRLATTGLVVNCQQAKLLCRWKTWYGGTVQIRQITKIPDVVQRTSEEWLGGTAANSKIQKSLCLPSSRKLVV